MDLFTLTCTTCKSRLRVRDPAAIGQILACPKCGGMVMIKPPPNWSEVSQAKADLPTATEVIGSVPPINQTVDSSAFDVVEELLSDAPPRVQPPPPPAPLAKPALPAGSQPPPPAPPPAAPGAEAAATPSPKLRFVGGPPAQRAPTPPAASPAKGEIKTDLRVDGKSAAAAPSASPSKATATVAQPAAAPTPARQAASPWRGSPESPPKTPADTESAALAPRHYWLWMSASVALGMLLALGAVMAAIRFLRSPSAAPPASTLAQPEMAAANARDGSASKPDGAGAVESTPQTTSEPSPADASPPAPQPAATAAATRAPAPPAEPTTAPAESDPVGLIAPPAPTAAATKNPEPLAKFDRILDAASGDPLAASTPPPLAPTPPTDSPARPLAPRPPPREVDVARRLADPLPGIDAAGTPLADFVQLMSDLTTIPITLELPLIPATAESPITLTATNTTVGKALSEALATVRLEYAISDDQLIVRRPEPMPPTPHSASVRDLTGGDEQRLVELVELIKAVVEPGAWDEGDESGSLTFDADKGTMVIQHRRAVQAQVLMALEKLRRAHSPPLAAVWKLDPATFALESRWSQARFKLDRPLTLTFSQPTPLVTILAMLGEVADVRIVVDWHDIASAGWNPAGEATLVASAKPLAAALDALLDPLDLTWRIIDGRTIQVVTPARLLSAGELEFYKVDDLIRDGQSGEALVARLQAALGEASFRSGGGIGELRYDAPSQCLLAWLPQPKQRELEELLNKARNGGK